MNDILIVRDMSDLIKVRREYPFTRDIKPKFVGQDLQRQLRGWVPEKIYVSSWAMEHPDWRLVSEKGGIIPYRVVQGSEIVCLAS